MITVEKPLYVDCKETSSFICWIFMFSGENSNSTANSVSQGVSVIFIQ
jgi:hypothetical protein